MPELQMSRMRNGGVYPVILGGLKHREQEAGGLVFHLDYSGLTTEKVGDVFEEIQGSLTGIGCYLETFSKGRKTTRHCSSAKDFFERGETQAEEGTRR